MSASPIILRPDRNQPDRLSAPPIVVEAANLSQQIGLAAEDRDGRVYDDQLHPWIENR
jgi:hypothetical protein